MKRISYVLVSIFFLSTIFFLGCTKIDTTTLGADLIPEVDNIHTFEWIVDLKTDNVLITDTTGIVSDDNLPVGYTDDPEFGQSSANLYFDINIPAAKVYPFGNKDSAVTDSVVLSLAYKGAYGDTNTSQTIRIYEISQTAGFFDTALYRVNQSDFATAGSELGNRTFQASKLKDSVQVIKFKDTSKVVNVLRIKLDPLFGKRLIGYDTSFSSNGGYYSDSIFNTLFRGLAIKTDQVGNALTYFNITDPDTKLIVYYHYGVRTDSTLTVEYAHPAAAINPFGVADVFKRTPGGGWNTYLNNATVEDDLLYIPSTPGSYGLIKLPELDTNRVIHLAEIILPVVPSAMEGIFRPQSELFLDMFSPGHDSLFSVQNDYVQSATGGNNLPQFGGFLRKYNGNSEYRFNISRHIQGAVTKKEPNLEFRVYAPFITNDFYLPQGSLFNRTSFGRVNLNIVPAIGIGRVVLGGGNNSNPNFKARLRIVYSKI